MIFSTINTLSDTAKFDRLLRCPENGLLNVLGYVSATIFGTPCIQSNFASRAKNELGEKCGLKWKSGIGNKAGYEIISVAYVGLESNPKKIPINKAKPVHPKICRMAPVPWTTSSVEENNSQSREVMARV